MKNDYKRDYFSIKRNPNTYEYEYYLKPEGTIKQDLSVLMPVQMTILLVCRIYQTILIHLRKVIILVKELSVKPQFI